MKVEDFVATISLLKTRFTNHERTKALVRNLLAEFGCDKDRTYFDVPRLRVVIQWATHASRIETLGMPGLIVS